MSSVCGGGLPGAAASSPTRRRSRLRRQKKQITDGSERSCQRCVPTPTQFVQTLALGPAHRPLWPRPHTYVRKQNNSRKVIQGHARLFLLRVQQDQRKICFPPSFSLLNTEIRIFDKSLRFYRLYLEKYFLTGDTVFHNSVDYCQRKTLHLSLLNSDTHVFILHVYFFFTHCLIQSVKSDPEFDHLLLIGAKKKINRFKFRPEKNPESDRKRKQSSNFSKLQPRKKQKCRIMWSWKPGLSSYTEETTSSPDLLTAKRRSSATLSNTKLKRDPVTINLMDAELQRYFKKWCCSRRRTIQGTCKTDLNGMIMQMLKCIPHRWILTF